MSFLRNEFFKICDIEFCRSGSVRGSLFFNFRKQKLDKISKVKVKFIYRKNAKVNAQISPLV